MKVSLAKQYSFIISDLHLDAKQEKLLEQFAKFLHKLEEFTNAYILLKQQRNNKKNQVAQNKLAISLFIIGDFLALALQDTVEPWFKPYADRLAKLAQQGVNIYFQSGNRDFLLKEEFAKSIGAQLLPDYAIIAFGKKENPYSLVLCHGDTLCLSDIGYLKYRKIMRGKLVDFISKNSFGFVRKFIANKISQASKTKAQNLSSHIDLDIAYTKDIISQYQTLGLICGHIHKQRFLTYPTVNSLQNSLDKYALELVNNFDDSQIQASSLMSSTHKPKKAKARTKAYNTNTPNTKAHNTSTHDTNIHNISINWEPTDNSSKHSTSKDDVSSPKENSDNTSFKAHDLTSNFEYTFALQDTAKFSDFAYAFRDKQMLELLYKKIYNQQVQTPNLEQRPNNIQDQIIQNQQLNLIETISQTLAKYNATQVSYQKDVKSTCYVIYDKVLNSTRLFSDFNVENPQTKEQILEPTKLKLSELKKQDFRFIASTADWSNDNPSFIALTYHNASNELEFSYLNDAQQIELL